jgi:hypothetical protein
LQEIAASIRAPAYLDERMFPQLRERIGSALDLVVELSTLGEYRLGADGAVWPASALAPAPEREPQLGGAGDPLAGRAAVRRIVAGGATGPVPVATPAARRLARAAPAAKPPPAHTGGPVSGPRPARAATVSACRGERRRSGSEQPARRPKPRPGAPVAPEQLCLAV